jgi:hypothetical protein
LGLRYNLRRNPIELARHMPAAIRAGRVRIPQDG